MLASLTGSGTGVFHAGAMTSIWWLWVLVPALAFSIIGLAAVGRRPSGDERSEPPSS